MSEAVSVPSAFGVARQTASSVRPWAAGARIALVSSQPLILEALAGRMAAIASPVSLVYTGPFIREAVEQAAERGCDCAIVDVDERSVPSAAEAVSALAMRGISVIVLVDDPSVEGYEICRSAGARGYVGKRSDPVDLASAVHAVLAGDSWAPSACALGFGRSTSVVRLSTQERRTLVLYASGMTQQMVARRMGIAPSTVKHYLDRVRQKYGDAGVEARTKLELHSVARREGWLP